MGICVSQNGLQAWLQTDIGIDQVVTTLNAAGLEVDSVSKTHTIDPLVVIGYVESVQPHPNADRLRCCKVRVANDVVLDIVCGCSTVCDQRFVVVAQVGAKLPCGLCIKPTKLRGEPSNGMLCSASELGLVDESQGILMFSTPMPIGTAVQKQLRWPDCYIDLDITPDRGDCLSEVGVARELWVHGFALNMKASQSCPAEIEQVKQDLAIADRPSCPDALMAYRLLYANIAGINAETPLWQQAKLWATGHRPISFIVDLTNVMMHAFGTPMHAFDADLVQGLPHVRHARCGETLVLLDQNEITLDDRMLVIADDQGPIALAGIMGGASTAVTAKTTRVIFELAHFKPEAIAYASQKLKISTESSQRFERGIDGEQINHVWHALHAALSDVCDVVYDAYHVFSSAQAQAPIVLRSHRASRVLGVPMSVEDMTELMVRAGCNVTPVDDSDGIACEPPSHRNDLTCEIELIEELIRLKGFDALPYVPPSVDASASNMDLLDLQQRWTQALVASSFHEIIAYSFIDEKYQRGLQSEMHPMVAIENPLSPKMSLMRPSLLYGLCEAALFNLKRQIQGGRFFEFGKRFVANAEQNYDHEVCTLSGLVFGKHEYAMHWQEAYRQDSACDFYGLKGMVQALLEACYDANDIVFEANASHALLHPNVTAEVHVCGQCVGHVGQLHPAFERQFKNLNKAFAFELDVPSKSSFGTKQFVPFSKYPSSRKDLSFFVCNTVRYGDMLKVINRCKSSYLSDVALFDTYGANVPEGQKSFTMALTFQASDHTLTDEQVMSDFEGIVRCLQCDLNIQLRGEL